MVEEIKKLEADTQLSTLPVWDLRVLYDREISIEITGSTEVISPLREGNQIASTNI